MKKFFKIALALVMICSLTACKGDSTKDQENVVNSFFTAIKAYNIDQASDLCTSYFIDDFDFISTSESMEMLQTIPMFSGGKIPAALDNFMKNLYDKIVESYTIGEIKVEDDRATVNVTMKIYDLSQVEDIFDNDAFYAFGEKLGTEHSEEVIELWNTYSDEDDLNREIINLFADEFFGFIQNQIEKKGRTEVTAVFELVKEDDAWKIDGIQRQ